VNLETRCPFLDYRLVELGFSMHEDLLMNNGFGKHVLRQVVQGRLPDELVWSRRKQGFSNSTESVLRRIVERDGLSRVGLDCALQMGLLLPGVRERSALGRLPNSVLFRLVTLLSWLERFYAATPGPAAEGA
jgi:hypothetical protein